MESAAVFLDLMLIMPRSEHDQAMDRVQLALRPVLQELGFRVRGRTFNRTTGDQLTQVINFQAGQFEPPGSEPFAGLRQSKYGSFTINVGLYIPEVARYHGYGEASGFVQDPDCCLRARLGELGPEDSDLWWPISSDEQLLRDLRRRLIRHAFAALSALETRDQILHRLQRRSARLNAEVPARIICALIHFARGAKDQARALLSAQEEDARARNPRHAQYVRTLARRLKLGQLDG